MEVYRARPLLSPYTRPQVCTRPQAGEPILRGEGCVMWMMDDRHAFPKYDLFCMLYQNPGIRLLC